MCRCDDAGIIILLFIYIYLFILSLLLKEALALSAESPPVDSDFIFDLLVINILSEDLNK